MAPTSLCADASKPNVCSQCSSNRALRRANEVLPGKLQFVQPFLPAGTLPCQKTSQDKTLVTCVCQHSCQHQVPCIADESQKVGRCFVLSRSGLTLIADDLHRTDHCVEVEQATTERFGCGVKPLFCKTTYYGLSLSLLQSVLASQLLPQRCLQGASSFSAPLLQMVDPRLLHPRFSQARNLH